MSSSDDDDIPLGQLMNKSTAGSAAAAPAVKAEVTPKRQSTRATPVRASAAKASAKRGHVDSSEGEEEEEVDDDDDEEEEEEEEEEERPKKKKKAAAKKQPAKPKAAAPKKETKTPVKRAVTPKRETEASTASAKKSKPAAPTKKAMKYLELLDMAMKGYKWWEAPPLAKDQRWTYIEHNGVYFAPEYVRHNVPVLYEGKPVVLETSDQEEMATFYAGIAPDGPQLGTPKLAEVFNRNFMRDWKMLLGAGHTIQDFTKCDFGRIREYLEEKKKLKNAHRKGVITSTEESELAKVAKAKKDVEEAKKEKEALLHKYGFAIVGNDHIEKLGNTTIEPPGLFRGRGEHPKMGSLKQRVMPEDITINIAKGAPVPKCPLPGHNWKSVVHDPSVTWLAYWRENVMGSFKYVFLAASSSFKGKSDMAKYDKARRLCLNIDRIRSEYERSLKPADDPKRHQLATAIWIIDRLALRVGNEKDDDEADTVGCCSLRVEHMTFPTDGHVELNFLGKDSMPYHQVIELSRYGDTGLQVFKNLRRFCDKKAPAEEVFDLINTTSLNKELTTMMPGLSAKVFRTYNASVTLEKELAVLDIATDPGTKVIEYTRANREVAILCNHQRTVPKGFQESFDKMNSKIEQLKSQLSELQRMKADVAKGKAIALKEGAAETAEGKAAEAHLFPKQPTADQVETRIKSWNKKVRDLETQIKLKDDNKTVALGTAKINYMDPRITVAWCKKVECPIERVFPKTLRDKFPWAMSVPESWTFAPKAGGAGLDLADEDSDDERPGGEEGEEEDDEDVKPKASKKKGSSPAAAAKSSSKNKKKPASDDEDDDDDE